MFLTIEFGALAVLHHLVEIALQHIRDFTDFRAQLGVELRAAQRLPQFVDQLNRDGREIIDKIERVLDFVGDAGGELAERREFFCLHQAVLRGAQVLQ